MSEYQYYEFQASDRPLGEDDRVALRALSTRARITTTSFTNHYEWGDFKGDPRRLMERWFDLHLYLTNWGTRRLMMRFPKRLMERSWLEVFLLDVDWVAVWAKGDHLIVDMCRDEVEEGYDDWDDGSGWLGALAPLRHDVLSGDLRLFYLLWLTVLEDGVLEADEAEPLAGIGPLTGALEAAVEFFGIDRDLVQAVAERSGGAGQVVPEGALRNAIAGLSDAERGHLLLRVAKGEPYVGAAVRRTARVEETSPVAGLRTVSELTARAAEIRRERERAKAKQRAEEQRRLKAEAERVRRKHLDALKQRGEDIWTEIETEIARRNASGYDRAAALLFDLKAIAQEEGSAIDFNRRLGAIRNRHARKERFLERLKGLGER